MVSEQVESNPAAPPTALPEPNGPAPVETDVVSDDGSDAGVAARRRTVAVWLAAIVGFLLFVALASVSREAGELGGKVRLTRAWALLADNLPDGTAVQVLFWGAAALVLVASGAALWLALTANSPDRE